jgi:uracil-DNA glycosylase
MQSNQEAAGYEHNASELIAQHAMTAKLLGVDFLPLGNPGSVEVGSGYETAHETGLEEVQAAGRAPVDVDSQTNKPDLSPISAEELASSYQHLSNPHEKMQALARAYEEHAPHQYYHEQFHNIVFGEGDAGSDVMFVGEAPGEEEDRTGRPFVGRAGQLLEKMIVAMGLSRESVYISNVLKTRPPNNATPTQRETALCSPYLIEQIKIVQPRVVVTLGLPASQLLIKSTSPMRALRGHWHRLGCDGHEGLGEIEVMPTYHPAYLLRSYTPENRRKVWSDLTMVMEKLGLKSQ